MDNSSAMDKMVNTKSGMIVYVGTIISKFIGTIYWQVVSRKKDACFVCIAKRVLSFINIFACLSFIPKSVFRFISKNFQYILK